MNNKEATNEKSATDKFILGFTKMTAQYHVT